MGAAPGQRKCQTVRLRLFWGGGALLNAHRKSRDNCGCVTWTLVGVTLSPDAVIVLFSWSKHCSSTYQLSRSLVQPRMPMKKTYDKIVKMLKIYWYFNPKPSPIIQRFNVNARDHHAGESLATMLLNSECLENTVILGQPLMIWSETGSLWYNIARLFRNTFKICTTIQTVQCVQALEGWMKVIR